MALHAHERGTAGWPHREPTITDQHLQIQIEMFDYAQKLGREKRRNPQNDVWTILSTVEVETDDGERTALSQVELDLFFMLLTIAGSETTRNAVSQGLVALLDHPTQLQRLRSEPGAISLAVEEVLRWSSPVSYFARRATLDTEVRGVPIAKGDRVTMWFPSANRDEEVFDDPFHFDIGRSPNPHVTFGGGGVHFCLGAHLARREPPLFWRCCSSAHAGSSSQESLPSPRSGSSTRSCSSCGSYLSG